jgi:hypothetical protein
MHAEMAIGLQSLHSMIQRFVDAIVLGGFSALYRMSVHLLQKRAKRRSAA